MLIGSALGEDISPESLVSDDLPPIFCDRLQLENSLLNLAINARHAMPKGGILMIEAVRCALRDHGECVSLSVADTGCGMSRSAAERAFEPFFSTRLMDGGSGLGLFNVRSFVERLGGSVQLSTRQKHGTRVMLHLPSMGELARSA
jgi:signal transduction histidine kinase